MRNTRLDLPLSMERMSNATPPVLPVEEVKASNPMLFVKIAGVFMAIVLLVVVVWHFPRHPDVLYTTPISASQEESIRSILLSRHNKVVRWNYVDPYYGTINDCIIFVLHPFGTPKQELWQQEIAGYTFEWDNSIELYVCWYEKSYNTNYTNVCTLKEAYENGLLTKEHIGKIYERHNEYRAAFPKLLEEWNKTRDEN